MTADPIKNRGAGKVQMFDTGPEPPAEQERLNQVLRRKVMHSPNLKIDRFTWADENLANEYPADPNAVNPNQHLLIYLKVHLPAGITSVQGRYTKLPNGEPFPIEFLKDVPDGKAFIISHSELDPRSKYRLDFGEKFPNPQYPVSSEIHTVTNPVEAFIEQLCLRLQVVYGGYHTLAEGQLDGEVCLDLAFHVGAERHDRFQSATGKLFQGTGVVYRAKVGAGRTVVRDDRGRVVGTFPDLTVYDFERLVDGPG